MTFFCKNFFYFNFTKTLKFWTNFAKIFFLFKKCLKCIFFMKNEIMKNNYLRGQTDEIINKLKEKCL